MYLPITKNLLDIAENHGTPTYAYDLSKVRSQFEKLSNAITHPNKRIFYAVKANWHPEILQTLLIAGSGIECVSKGEVQHALSHGFKPAQIIFTGSGQSADELTWIHDQGIMINADSLYQLEILGNHGVNKISLRLNNDLGEGDHNHLVTGGSKSKFGIHYSQIDKAKELAKEYSFRIVGLHQHVGSHILEEHIFTAAMEALFEQAKHFDDLEFLDFGGSFGVPYHPGVDELDIKKLGKLISGALNSFDDRYGKKLEYRFEPGRYLVAESGTLLVKVTDIKHHPHRTFILFNSGMNHLARPALYDAYHHITNLSQTEGDHVPLSFGGNICESGDLFALDRSAVVPKIGDILAIHTAGAYGYCMSSHYNLHELPNEVCYGS